MNTLISFATNFETALAPISGILIGITVVLVGWFVWSQLPSGHNSND